MLCTYFNSLNVYGVEYEEIKVYNSKVVTSNAVLLYIESGNN